MPYDPDNLDTLPEAVQKLPAKKQRQFAHVFNSVYERTKDEGRAYAAAWSVVKGDEEKVVASPVVLNPRTGQWGQWVTLGHEGRRVFVPAGRQEGGAPAPVPKRREAGMARHASFAALRRDAQYAFLWDDKAPVPGSYYHHGDTKLMTLWRSVARGAYTRHGDISRAVATAYASLAKAQQRARPSPERVEEKVSLPHQQVYNPQAGEWGHWVRVHGKPVFIPAEPQPRRPKEVVERKPIEPEAPPKEPPAPAPAAAPAPGPPPPQPAAEGRPSEEEQERRLREKVQAESRAEFIRVVGEREAPFYTWVWDDTAPLPPNVLKQFEEPRLQRMWGHVWRSAYWRHRDLDKAFGMAWGVTYRELAKTKTREARIRTAVTEEPAQVAPAAVTEEKPQATPQPEGRGAFRDRISGIQQGDERIVASILAVAAAVPAADSRFVRQVNIATKDAATAAFGTLKAGHSIAGWWNGDEKSVNLVREELGKWLMMGGELNIAHEFGHTALQRITPDPERHYGRLFEDQMELLEEIKRFYERAVKKNRAAKEKMRSFGGTGSGPNLYIISDYAETRYQEHFAEVYAHYIYHGARLKKREPQYYAWLKEHVFGGKEYRPKILDV